MTEIDDELVPETLAVVDEFGKLVAFEELTTNTHDPTTGRVTTVEISHNRKITPPQEVKLELVDNDLIQVGDMTFFVAASGLPFALRREMEVTIDSTVWIITRISPIRTGEQIAMYEVQVRN